MDENGYVTATLPSTVDQTFRRSRCSPTSTQHARRVERRTRSGSRTPAATSSSATQVRRFARRNRRTRAPPGHELDRHRRHEPPWRRRQGRRLRDPRRDRLPRRESRVPHGPVKVVFNPDEEIGRGVIHLPIDKLGAVAAYTVDGSTTGEVQAETFSGAQVRMKIRGRTIHPGTAKGELVNAIKLAAEIVARLPKDSLSPETTEGREGFIHPVVVAGESSEVELRFIVRDFENDRLAEHVAFLRTLAEEVAVQRGARIASAARNDNCSVRAMKVAAALLTRISSGASRQMAAIMASTAAPSRISHWIASALLANSSQIAAAVVSSRSNLRPQIMSSAPSSANRRPIAAPSPEPPPVTRMRFPASNPFSNIV